MPARTVLLVRSEHFGWEGLRKALAQERRGDLHIQAEVEDAQTALALAAAECPDIVLTAAPIDDTALLPFLAALRAACPQSRIIVIPESAEALEDEELIGLAEDELVSVLLWSDVSDSTVDRWLRTVHDGVRLYSKQILPAILAAQRRLLVTGAVGTPLRILVADANELDRAGLEALLGKDPRFALVGQRMQNPVSATRQLQPDLIVLDPGPPGRFNINLVAEIRRVAPAAKICLYTAVTDTGSFLRAMQAGESAYLLKGTDDYKALVETLAFIGRRGGRITGQAMLDYFAAHPESLSGLKVPQPLVAQLTPREREATELLLAGLTTQEIARRLGLKSKTAENHILSAMHRLDARTREQLVFRASRAGIEPPDADVNRGN